MLKPVLQLTSELVKLFAGTFLSKISIDSIPIWKGEAVVDDLEINSDGINQILEKAQSSLSVNHVNVSRVKVRLPLLSPGTKPLQINIFALDLDVHVGKKRKKNKKKESTRDENDESQSKNKKGYISKLTSNIEIIINGISVKSFFRGLDINMAVEDVKITLKNGKINVLLNNFRLNLKAERLVLLFDMKSMDISMKDENAIIDFKNFNIRTSVPVFSSLVDDLTMKIIAEPNMKLTVLSESPLSMEIDLEIIPGCFDLFYAFLYPMGPKSFFIFFMNDQMVMKLPELYLKFRLTKTLAIEMSMKSFNIKNGKYTITPFEVRLLLRDGIAPIIEPINVNGNYVIVKRKFDISANIDTLKISFPLSRDIINQIKSIKFKIPPPPFPDPYKRPQMKIYHKKFNELRQFSCQNRIVKFSFDTPIFPVAVSFESGIEVGGKVLIRVWDDSLRSFVAFSDFEIDHIPAHFSFDHSQMIPLKKFQFVFSGSIEGVEEAVFSYLNKNYLGKGADIDINIGSVLLTLDSDELPTAAVSATDFRAKARFGPVGAIRMYASMGVSLLLSNFRNSTMVSIVDVPSFTASYSKMPSFSEVIPEELPRYALATIQQDAICSDSSSASLRIPSVCLNIVPTVITDFVRYISTMDIGSIIAYTLENLSDTPYVFRASTSPNLSTIEPKQQTIITFLPDESHYILFPLAGSKVMLNAPGIYHITDTNYIEVKVTAPFTFRVTIYSSTIFRNFLDVPIKFTIRTPSQAGQIVEGIGVDGVCSSSVLLNTSFKLSLELENTTDPSDFVTLSPNLEKPAVMVVCNVINMLPPIYICAPQFCAWIAYREHEAACIDGQRHVIQEFSFLPVLVIKNRLPVHVLTSAGVVPPNQSRYISQLTDKQIVFDGSQTISVGFPLKRKNILLTLMGKPCKLESSPETNTITVTVSYLFRNDTAFPLIFSVRNMDPMTIEPNTSIALESLLKPDSIKIGFADGRKVRYSSSISVPSTAPFSIGTSNGAIYLIADFSENRAVVYPQAIAINESESTVWLNPVTSLEPMSQAQLLIWRQKYHYVSFSLSANEGYSENVDVDSNVTWIRSFSGRYGESPYTYITYSVQSKADPHAIVFHKDTAPPLTLIDDTPLSFQVNYENRSVFLAANHTLFLPEVPNALIFSRSGSEPFTISLRYSTDSIIVRHKKQLFIRIEVTGTQTRVVLSESTLPPSILAPKFNTSLFVASCQIFVYNDLTNPGVPQSQAALTIRPISLDIVHQAGTATSVSLVIETFQIDSLFSNERFPVIFMKTKPDDIFLSANVKLSVQLNGRMFIEVVKVHLANFSVNIEENLLRFVLDLIPLIPITKREVSDAKRPHDIIILRPRFVGLIHCDSVEIRFSLSTQSIINADFRSVPVHLSLLHLENVESFDVSILQIILAHYVSDVIASIPSLFTSFSLIGAPGMLVSNSIESLRNFFGQAFVENDSVFRGIGQGSLMLMRGVSIGALESIVSLTSSLERSIGRFNPVAHEGESTQLSEVFTALFTLPIQGYRQEGIAGILRGVWRGTIGAVAGPASAILSLVSRTGAAALYKVSGDPTPTGDLRIIVEMKPLPVVRFEY